MKNKDKSLRGKDFILLMFGKSVSLLGTEMQNFALSLYVLKITGSAAKFASVLAVTLLPRIILGPVAGVFADWFDRKKIIVHLDLLRGGITGVFAVIFLLNGELPISAIYILVLTMAGASLLFQPAIMTVIPTIVEKDKLVQANAVNSFIMNTATFAAPLLGGVAMGRYGILIILIFNSVSFILSALSEIFIAIPKTNKKPEKISFESFTEDFMKGISFIKTKKIIVSVIMIACILNFSFAAVGSVGITFISKNILKVSDYQFGILQAVFISSMMIAPVLATTIAKKYEIGKMIFWDIIITSALIGVMAVIISNWYLGLFEGNMIPYISLLTINFLIGLILSVGNIALSTVVQQQVPLELMGRVGTVRSTGAMAAIPLGQMVFGFMFDRFHGWICLMISCSILFSISILMRKNLLNEEKNEDMKNINVS